MALSGSAGNGRLGGAGAKASRDGTARTATRRFMNGLQKDEGRGERAASLTTHLTTQRGVGERWVDRAGRPGSGAFRRGWAGNGMGRMLLFARLAAWLRKCGMGNAEWGMKTKQEKRGERD